MEQVTSSYKVWFLFWAILVFDLVFKASSNVEGVWLLLYLLYQGFSCSINVYIY
jgi:hypothetical protein